MEDLEISDCWWICQRFTTKQQTQHGRLMRLAFCHKPLLLKYCKLKSQRQQLEMPLHSQFLTLRHRLYFTAQAFHMVHQLIDLKLNLVTCHIMETTIPLLLWLLKTVPVQLLQLPLLSTLILTDCLMTGTETQSLSLENFTPPKLHSLVSKTIPNQSQELILLK